MMKSHEENLDDRYYDWALFRRILVYLKPYRILVGLEVVLLLGSAVFQLAGPYLTKIVIDNHIKLGHWKGLDTIAFIYLVVLIGFFIFQFGQTLLMQYIGQNVMMDLRRQVFAHLHKMSFRFFDRNPIGKMITRVVNDVEVLNEMLTSGLILVFSDLFTLAGIFIMLLYLDWRLTAMVCLVFIPLLIATQVFRKRARDALRKNRAHITTLNTFLQENLSGMDTVQVLNRERVHAERFKNINGDKLREDLRSLHYNAVYQPSIDVFSALGVGIIVWYGGGQFIQEQIQLGVLVAFLQYLQKFFEPIRDLAEKYNVIQSALASSERIFELLDMDQEIPNVENPIPVQSIAGRVEFQNVWFAYRDEEYVLKDISFTVEPGESLAIIGTTGSGKTTIINTLCRFYDIQKGRILVDGGLLKDFDKWEIRRQMALVQQDPFLFSGNILDNIRLGNYELDLTHIESLAQHIHLEDFIESLPGKYDFEVKEKGGTLSMGQKQLLAFARALAFDPRILILDEATSSIDTETEGRIQEGIQKLIRGRTSIVIAHRLTTLKHVDKVLVLKQGRVQEYGSKKELLEKKGVFYQLLQLQAQNG